MSVTFDDLYHQAKLKANPQRLTQYVQVGTVGAALLTELGNIYLGVCIDAACSLGFCAEHGAVAAMITASENRVLKMVAVHSSGLILSPCGRCRELISQLHPDNIATKVMISKNLIVSIRSLLPNDWKSDGNS